MPTIALERVRIRNNNNDYDDADDVHEPWNRSSFTLHHSDPDDDDHDSLQRASIDSKSIVVDIETSPEAPKSLQIPPSPSSAIALSNDSRIFPIRPSISLPSQPELPSPSTEYMGWDGLFSSQSSQASFPGLQQPVSAPVVISQSRVRRFVTT
jgi:hypothetical protein